MSSSVTFVYSVLRFLGFSLAKSFQFIIVGCNCFEFEICFFLYIFAAFFLISFFSKSELENDSFLMKNSVVSFFSNSFF